MRQILLAVAKADSLEKAIEKAPQTDAHPAKLTTVATNMPLNFISDFVRFNHGTRVSENHGSFPNQHKKYLQLTGYHPTAYLTFTDEQRMRFFEMCKRLGFAMMTYHNEYGGIYTPSTPINYQARRQSY